MSILSNVHPMGVLSRGGAAAVIDRISDVRNDQRTENDDSSHNRFSFYQAVSGNCALFFEAAS